MITADAGILAFVIRRLQMMVAGRGSVRGLHRQFVFQGRDIDVHGTVDVVGYTDQDRETRF